MLGGIGMVLALILFVVVHEAGHFFAAKASGMKVTEFFVGFGPRLWSTMRGETEVGFKAIPAGGYVRITGMNPFEDVDPADEGRTYRDKSLTAKLFVILSGVGANFLLAFLILFGLFIAYGEPGSEVYPIVGEVLDGSAAEAAGLQPGDRIVAIDGVSVADWEGAVELISARPGATVTLVLERDGATVSRTATLGSRQVDGVEQGFLGFAPVVEVTVRDVGIGGALVLAAAEVRDLTFMAYRFLGDLVTPSTLVELVGGIGGGEVSTDSLPVSIVGLAQIGSQADRLGLANMLYLMASINVILAALNIIPVLPLDGGHAAIATYERVFRRKVNLQALTPVAVAVVVLFVFIGVVSILLDITNPIDLPG